MSVHLVEHHDLNGKSRAEWLALRKPDVTASNIGALFSQHPYVSALRYFHDKAGLIELPEQQDNPILKRGRWFETAVATAVAEERPEWTLVQAKEYLRDPDRRLGATPDFYIDNDPRGRGVLQCKTVAPSVYARDWKLGRAPFYITLQTLTECMLADAAFGVAAALSVDAFAANVAIIEIPRHEKAEARIREAVAQFWLDIEAGREPPPDYNLDGELLRAITPHETAGKTIDLGDSNRAYEVIHMIGDLRIEMAEAKKTCRGLEEELAHMIGDAERVVGVPDFSITFKTTHTKEYTVPARDNRVLRITDKREE